MRLSDLRFETNYNSYENDLVSDFYIKALSNAKRYDRVSAFFDSKIIALYSTAIEKIYENDGKIRFIFSQQLSDEDYDLMQKGYANRGNDILVENFKHEELTEEEKLRLSNLSFLIEKGLVDIKIAFTKSGILHDKFGLIYNDEDYLFFRGSNNETVAAIESNHESFEVSCNWEKEELENKKIENAKETFEKMWNDMTYGMKVVTIPEIIKREIAKYSNGKLILEADIDFSNCIIADLNAEGKMIIRNNLNYNYDFDKDYDYKNFIKKYVVEVKDRITYFKNDISYITMEKIINKYNESAAYNNYSFKVSKVLRDYINGRNIQIDKRKELGKLIKKRDSIVINQFNKFSLIVNSEMERQLREKQMWDAFFIKEMKKSANYSVPGAGKTSIVYGAFAYLNKNGIDKVKKIIMIGPKNSFKSWKDEFVKCFGTKKELKLLNIQDKKYRRQNERISALRFDSENCNLILINYDLLPSLVDVLNEIINSETMLVFDEIHKIKAVGGVWSSAALDICKNAKYKVALTGTPIPNSYLDLYNQLNILFTDEYKTFFKFSTSDLRKPNDTLTMKINDLIYPFFCRTTKKQLNVPEPNPDEMVVSTMTNNEQMLFSYLRKKYSHNGLELYIRLLQASTNPKLLLKSIDLNSISELFTSEEEETDSNEYVNFENIKFDNSYDQEFTNLVNKFDMTSKFWEGIELVKKLVSEGKQVIVWGIFVDTINRIEEELNNAGISAKIIYGATDLEEREKRIEEFKAKQFKVLITNPHTLAESVSLHDTCHDAVYFEYSFNLTHMLQSRDRINRLGLPENQYTQYYYLVLKSINPDEDSIDLKTYNRLEEKKDIMLKSIEGELVESINFDIIDDIKAILGKD